MPIFRLFPVIVLVLLYGCATTNEQAATPGAAVKAVELTKPLGKKQQKESKTSIDPDVLFMLMTAEIAGQRGQYDVAMEGYLEAAKRVHDPRLTERAAMIAMYMKDGNKTNEAVSLWLKQDPNNLSARKIAALSALKAENKQQSVEQLSALLKQDPAGFEKTLFELAGALQKEDNVAFIYAVMDDLAVKHPDQASIFFIQSLLASDLKNKDLAERKIERALKLQPDWDKALILQAQLAVYGEDFKRAETLLRNASLKYPDNPKFKKMLAQVLIKSAKYEEAGEVYETLFANDPKDFESQFSLGLVHLQLDRDGKAEDIFKQLLVQADWRNQSNFYLGKIEEKRGNLENALSAFDKVTDGPFQFEAALTGISLLAKDKQYDRAEQRLKALPGKFPKQKPRIVLLRAELYSQQKQYEKAYSYLTEELSVYPDQEELLYSRALMADRMGNLGIMEADLQKILAKHPDNVEALNALGYSLADKTTRYAEAETYLLHALRLKPGEAVILDSYGWLKYRMGNRQAALDYLQKAYDKQPENEIAAHLAEVLWVSGKKEEAKKLIAKALQDAPDDSFLLHFKHKFLQLNSAH
ncbi:TPR repeat-containing protein [Methyloglobulus morosus KoM1]|uniref:TPR repeat-containing protein n=1 Tax=Methyloglobulus morosus KoM1 TaxID=1116472 RepID=V5BVA5_9GAMM|nr:tetratricopeptide repeat protein [Methyloglobulus morosus]ESS71799.1 TPR repeat-containing protein [Methyloglobulus morosus KoM1]